MTLLKNFEVRIALRKMLEIPYFFVLGRLVRGTMVPLTSTRWTHSLHDSPVHVLTDF